MLAPGHKLYLNEEQKDIVFFVGENETQRARFPAHKLILSLASPVFSAMLSGRFKEGETGEIIITDVTRSTFRRLLQFAYTGTLENSSVCILRDILVAADKYLMSELSRICFSHLEKIEINLDNFWTFLNITYSLYSESLSPKIVTNVLQYLDENAVNILSTEEFLNLDYLTLSKIMKRSSLKHIREIEIVKHVFHWSQVECCRRNLPLTSENERTVVGDIKHDIRYLSILPSPRDKFLDDAIIFAFLTQNEKHIILERLFKGCGGLPSPWNDALLKEPRDKISTVKFILNSNEVANGDMITTKTKSLLLVVSSNCLIAELVINVLPDDARLVYINVEITDLEGNIFSKWVNPQLGQRGVGRYEYKISGSMCLKEFTAYKVNFACLTGKLIEEYEDNCFCDNGIDRPFLFVGDFPSDENDVEKFQSRKFWEKVMSRDGTTEHFHETARNSIVKAVILII